MRWIERGRHALQKQVGPLLAGLIEAITAPAVFAIGLWGAAEWISIADPSAQLFRDLAQIGAALFVAFAIAAAGASAALRHVSREERDDWLGIACGVGVVGLLGIGTSVALAAYRDAGHAGWLDILGLCWVVTSLGLLGILVALLPYAAYNWSETGGSAG